MTLNIIKLLSRALTKQFKTLLTIIEIVFNRHVCLHKNAFELSKPRPI